MIEDALALLELHLGMHFHEANENVSPSHLIP